MGRPIESQFEPERVKEIRELVSRISALSLPPGSSRYYAVELIRCLENGVLLAGLHVAASLLELSVRSFIAQRIDEFRKASTFSENTRSVQRALEENRSIGFAGLVDALCEAGLFERDDVQKAKEFYRSIRIPIHHGLADRFYRSHMDELLADLWSFGPVPSHQFEEVIEDHALKHIAIVVGIMERNLV